MAIQKLIDLADKTGEINEANTRRTFIDPFFEILGWNMNNFEEVNNEEKVSKGYVDYAFKLNNIPKFYLEAKPLHTSIDNVGFMHQTVNYSWLKGVDIAVLTNFKKLIVFYPNVVSPTPASTIMFQINSEEYLDRFHQLSLLSKSSFQNKLIYKTAKEWGKGKESIPVTKQLFLDILECRERLFKDIQAQNQHLFLTEESLNHITNRIISRFIFIRTLEDKEFEENKLITLARTETKSLYVKLQELNKYLDNIYDANLFLHDLCDDVKISNDVLEKTIEILYSPNGQMHHYDFSHIDADILGNMYELFLGYIGKQNAKA